MDFRGGVGSSPVLTRQKSPTMKLLLPASLILNAGLIGFLGYLALESRSSTTEPASHPAAGTPSEPSTPAMQSFGQITSNAPASFSWSQLESTNYRTYIANLRRIECPEQTVRDLIAADLANCYAPRKQEITVRLASEPESLAHELADLRREETATLAALLNGADRQANSLIPAPHRHERPAPVMLPLALESIDLATLNLNEARAAAVQQLRQRFIEEIGGVSQDPQDPSYRERWLRSQPKLDEDLRGFLGVQAYQEYQVAARAKPDSATSAQP
jgi:hypothetical protein